MTPPRRRGPSERVASMEASPIRTISEGGPADAIPLGLGQPGWAMDPVAWEALQGSGPCGYTPHAGLDELRDTLAAAHGVERDRVVVTCGAEGALTCALVAWLDPGDRLLIPDPGFVAYAALGRILGVRCVRYPLRADDRFRLDGDAILERLDDPDVRAVIVNLPSNPTGGAGAEAELAAVAEACAERGILLLSDEAYRELYLGTRPAGLVELGRGGVTIGSLSKAWAAPGLRIGWMVGDPDIVQAARVVQGYAVIAPARPAQRAAMALLRDSERVLAESRRQLAIRWEAFEAALREHFPGSPARPPDGGFYHWLQLPESAWDDPFGACLRLRDESGVVVIPGIAFGAAGRRHARVSFAGDPATFDEGLGRIARHFARSEDSSGQS